MTVAIRHLEAAPVMYVAANMRPADAHEIYATRWPLPHGADNPAAIAADVVNLSRFGAVAWWDDKPVCAIGAIELWPGVYSVWMFATPAWPKVARAVTRWCKVALRPLMLAAGGHRAQCQVIGWYAVARRWLEHLGFEVEAPLRGYGRNGEDFVSMVWRPRSDVRSGPIRRQQAVVAADAAAGAAAGAGP